MLVTTTNTEMAALDTNNGTAATLDADNGRKSIPFEVEQYAAQALANAHLDTFEQNSQPLANSVATYDTEPLANGEPGDPFQDVEELQQKLASAEADSIFLSNTVNLLTKTPSASVSEVRVEEALRICAKFKARHTEAAGAGAQGQGQRQGQALALEGAHAEVGGSPAPSRREQLLLRSRTL